MACYVDPTLPQWKGNLHTHTTQSDGRLSPEDVTALYHQAGYDFLALTDHRKVTPAPVHDPSLLLLPGVELDYTLPRQVVHIVGVGVDASVMEAPDVLQSPQQGIDAIRQSGGQAILAHPAWSLNTPETIMGLKGLSAVEIFNQVSQPPWNARRADSSAVLDLCSAAGHCLPVVAGDDAHFYNGDACQAFLMLSAPALSRENVLHALAQGHFYASQGPRFREVKIENGVLSLKFDAVEQIVFYSNFVWVSNRARRKPGMREASYPLNEKETFIRAEITDAQGKRAWMPPIFLRQPQ